MNVKKILTAGTVALVLTGSVLPASAAGIDSDYINTLRENGAADLILNVDAYRTAYGDLDAAFGDDTNSYIMHYLTTGMYEGRTIGVLFNPLVYAETYSDIKEAFGDDICAVINHYVTSGITENRTAGSAGSYADLAEAEREYAQKTTNAQESRRAAAYNGSAAGNNTAGSYASGNSNTTDNNSSTGSSSTISGAATGSSTTVHHTTSIIADDGVTLIRVEYYNADNRLFQYSKVTGFDSATRSYTEYIYSCDNVLIRTDTYVNGVRVSSVTN